MQYVHFAMFLIKEMDSLSNWLLVEKTYADLAGTSGSSIYLLVCR